MLVEEDQRGEVAANQATPRMTLRSELTSTHPVLLTVTHPRSPSTPVKTPSTASIVAALVLLLIALIFFRASPTDQSIATKEEGKAAVYSPNMSRALGTTKSAANQLISQFRDVTGASQADAQRIFKKHKTLEGAIEEYYSTAETQSRATVNQSTKQQEKKLGDIWERFKDKDDPRLVKIEGTMELCEELEIDLESDSVVFCLALDLGSKALGEWEKESWVRGWLSQPGNIESIQGMKSRLPGLRQQLNSDPAYFKKVYMLVFDLVKPPGSRTLPLDTAIAMWGLFIPPALESRPSALSRIPQGENVLSTSTARPPEFSDADFQEWMEFQKGKAKAVTKDTWSLFVDFIRSIDKAYKEYDDSAAWPSTIDDFVDHIRAKRG